MNSDESLTEYVKLAEMMKATINKANKNIITKTEFEETMNHHASIGEQITDKYNKDRLVEK